MLVNFNKKSISLCLLRILLTHYNDFTYWTTIFRPRYKIKSRDVLELWECTADERDKLDQCIIDKVVEEWRKRLRASTTQPWSQPSSTWTTDDRRRAAGLTQQPQLISWYSYKEEMLTERQHPSRGTIFMRWIARWAASGTEYLSNAVPFTRTLRSLSVEISPNWLNAFSRLLLLHFLSRFSITILYTMYNFHFSGSP